MNNDNEEDETYTYRFACCLKCLERIKKEFRARDAVLWRDICFEYVIHREPLLMDCKNSKQLEYLERRGYVLTHEDEDGDLLVKPLGYIHEPGFNINELFCVCDSPRRKHGKKP